MVLDSRELRERVEECIKNLLKRAEIRKKIRPEPDRIAEQLTLAASLLEEQRDLVMLLESMIDDYTS